MNSCVLDMEHGPFEYDAVRYVTVAGKAAALSSKAEKKSEAGIVLRIFIQNFMCHKKLRVKFCR